MSDHKGKNPWGNNGNGDDGGNIWGGNGSGGSGGNGGGQEPPDMDEMIRRAQSNLNNVLPGGAGGQGKIIGLGLVFLLALWLISGFYVVNPGEHAVIQKFGAWSRTQADPGLGYHLPYPVETVAIFNVEEIRKMNIGFQDAFARGRNGVGARDIPDESLMLTSDRNIVNLHLEIQWNIKSSEQFVFEIRDQENTIKKVAESAIREVVGQTNMFRIITNKRKEVADQTKDIIQKNLDQYNSGVNITSVLIQKAELHPDVQDAFQDVQSAKQDAEDVQNRAEAYRKDILPKARGAAIKMLEEAQAYKESAIARASGDADRFNSVYKAYLTGKDVTKERLYLEALEDVLGNAQKIIMSEGGSGVVPYLPLDEMKRDTKR